MNCDVLIVGGGVGGCAAALASTSLGARTVLTEECAWLGGQLTSQAVPPDEHPWIESFGCTHSYRTYRELVRLAYRSRKGLTARARNERFLNPGLGWVSRLCHEPHVGLMAIMEMLGPAVGRGALEIAQPARPVRVHMKGDRIECVVLQDLKSGNDLEVRPKMVVDATETGELLPLAGAEYVVGAESQAQTGEPHALPGEPEPENVQAFTWCFAMGWDPGGSHVIEKPAQYEKWRAFRPEFWPGPLIGWRTRDPVTLRERDWRLFSEDGELGLFEYRRIVCGEHFEAGQKPREVTIVNWPQNDYIASTILDRPPDAVSRSLEEARQLSLSLLYWLQTEAPRPDGGQGYPGLYLDLEVTGTRDGLAMSPYIRESRRIRAEFTVTELHVSTDCNLGKRVADPFFDSVGVGAYRIDLHPSANGRNYLDISSLPFTIPLGALIPVRLENLLAGCKNIGTTHIANGCYRLHPVEWNIGEAAGALAALCVDAGLPPRAVRSDARKLEDFQRTLVQMGFELAWPEVGPL